MWGTLTIGGKTYPVLRAELHVPVTEDGRYMHLFVRGGPRRDMEGFALYDVGLPLLKSVDDLDGQRIHVRPDRDTYEDDSLGTDIISMTELNYWQADGRNYAYGEIQVDFARIRERQYRCRFWCTLVGSENADHERTPGASVQVGAADFVVTADERDPWSEDD